MDGGFGSQNIYICVNTVIFVGDTMGNITLSVPGDVHENMRHYPEVKWSEVARRAIKEKLETLQLAETLAEKSKLTEKDVKEFSKMINSLAAKRFI